MALSTDHRRGDVRFATVTEEIRLWPAHAPGSEGWTQVESSFVDGGGAHRTRNVVVPTITPFLPDPAAATGTAVIVAPGGGFHMLSMGDEGVEVAEWLQGLGVVAFLLKYRLVDTGPNDDDLWPRFLAALAELGTRTPEERLRSLGIDTAIEALAARDGVQAVRTVRERAAEWGLHDGRLGFLGFSAGAFLGSAVALSDDPADRPDFLAAIYGGTAVEAPADAPPLFTAVCADDALSLDGCLAAFAAWRAAGRRAELHVYGTGGHGFGITRRGLPADAWTDQLTAWMTAEGFLPA